MGTSVVPAVEVVEATVEDGRRMLNEQARDKLGLSRESFWSGSTLASTGTPRTREFCAS